MTEFMGELLGTMVLIILGVGVVGGVLLKWSKAEGAGWIVITLGWGLAVVMGVYVAGTASDAHINPAVTLGFAAIGEFPWSKVPTYIAGQMIGAIIGAAIVFFNYLPHWRETESKRTKLDVFATAPGTSEVVRKPLQNLVSEIIGTFILVMGLLFIGANAFSEGLNPIVVGLLIIVIGTSLGGATGYAINPARDLGPRIAHALLPIPGKGGSDWGYAWVPVIGPIIGGIYGALFYKAFTMNEFTIAFWITSALVAILMIGAAVNELKGQKASNTNVKNKMV
ncbi:aquaporin family protein [Cerasibacillus terrae]|uniref:Aquaporin family protein n=1 Tax=Cerasibacillus terrae TaxID=2498845 RepID=A0A5C8NLE3_9BACI|nr:MIP/aquaporin family protein [Cerasibacillus terrae]TXL61715.1 aquaporin family protein [Cerasibacillus terrae]